MGRHSRSRHWRTGGVTAALLVTVLLLGVRASDSPVPAGVPAAASVRLRPAPPAGKPPPARAIASPESYVITPGASLWGVARSFCGDPQDWRQLWKANMNEIMNPNVISPGQVIVISC